MIKDKSGPSNREQPTVGIFKNTIRRVDVLTWVYSM